MKLYKVLKLNNLQIRAKEKPQSTFRKGDLLLGLLLFPHHSLANVYSYSKHPLSSTLEAKKNTFYRFKNDTNINWRSIVSSYNFALFKELPVPVHRDLTKSKLNKTINTGNCVKIQHF